MHTLNSKRWQAGPIGALDVIAGTILATVRENSDAILLCAGKQFPQANFCVAHVRTCASGESRLATRNMSCPNYTSRPLVEKQCD